SVAHQLVHVRTLHRVAAREHKHTRIELAHLLKQRAGLGGRQLARMPEGLRFGPAVQTRQVAGLGHLPDEHERTIIEIECGWLHGPVLLRTRVRPGLSIWCAVGANGVKRSWREIDGWSESQSR